MSRGLVLGVILGGAGATAFWRIKMQDLKRLKPEPERAPPPPKTAAEPEDPEVEVIEAAEPARAAKSAPVTATRAPPPVAFTSAAPPPSAPATPQATLSAASSSPSEQLLATPTSPGTARASQERAAKNAVLVDKFMTKLVIPKLHDTVKRLFEVDEGLKQVRTAAQAEKPTLFVKLGESCFAQLQVGLQAFCLLKLLIAVKVNHATRHGKPKAASKKNQMDSIKKDIVAAVDKFLKDGLGSLVADARASAHECLASFPIAGKPTTRLKCACNLEKVQGLVDSLFASANARAVAKGTGVIRTGEMLVYLASTVADDPVVAQILRSDSAQAAAAASMASFRGIVEAHHVKYFGDLKTDPMYLKLIPATDNVVKHTHLLSSQESVNPYLSAMGQSQAEFMDLCSEVNAGSTRWSDGAEPIPEPDTPPPEQNPFDDPD